MHEIFISYRRVDTEASAGHLYENLCAAYGEQAVFMDARANNIPWGSDWQARLEAGLQGCQVLVALIGPQWLTCERAPGLRRLDAEDDWVRNEIATSLQRGVRVLPVLLQGAQPVAEGQLPRALAQAGMGLHHCQAKPVTEALWAEDVQRLLAALDEAPALASLHQKHTARNGFDRVRELMRRSAVVAQAIGSSRQVIQTADYEIDEIRLLKAIHDGFHEIEGQCLIPIRGPGAMPPGLSQVRDFVRALREVRSRRNELGRLGRPLPSMLEAELDSSGRVALAALCRAVREPSDEHHALAVDALEALLGQLPMRLNDEIAHAANLIELKQLKTVLQQLVDQIGPVAPEDRELNELGEAVRAIGVQSEELDARVREHGWLQSLNNMLRNLVGGLRRAGTGARMEPAALSAGWNAVLRVRARFRDARTAKVRQGDRWLARLEDRIGKSVQAGQEAEAAVQLADYANEVVKLFREVDAELKQFSSDLRARTEPLKMLLRLSDQPPPAS